jgi:transcription antitermination factor NusA-like protein
LIRRTTREVAMPIELSREEKELLVGLLEKEFDEVRTEIHHTQGHDYKENLKAREKLVQALLVRLRG